MSPLKRYPRADHRGEAADGAASSFAPELVRLAADARAAKVELGGALIASVRDALDIVGTAAFCGFELVVLEADQLTSEFFDLRSGLAGEIAQKFVNYRVRLAVVGDFAAFDSEALAAYIRESNRGGHVAFVGGEDAALATLGRGGAV